MLRMRFCATRGAFRRDVPKTRKRPSEKELNGLGKGLGYLGKRAESLGTETHLLAPKPLNRSPTKKDR